MSFEQKFTNGPISLSQLSQLCKEVELKKVMMAEMAVLNTCQVTGKVGCYGDTIRAAVIYIERNGETEKMRFIVHNSVKAGRSYKGGRIKSVKRAGCRAKVGKTFIGGVESLYPIITS